MIGVQPAFNNPVTPDESAKLKTALTQVFGWDGPVVEPLPDKRPENCGTGFCSCVECLYQAVSANPL